MMGVVLHPAGLLDDFSDAIQRPKVSFESPLLRPLFENRRKVQALSRVKSRHSAGAASTAQSVPPLSPPNVIPTMGAWTAYLKAADDFRLWFALDMSREPANGRVSHTPE